MLKIKTTIGKSSIHGWGLFADQFVPKGTTTWQYEPACDPSFTKEEVENMDAVAKEFMHMYAYFDHDLQKFVLCSDSQKYINHSNNPENITIHSTPKEDVAAKDIQPGEELLCDYFLFDPGYFGRHGLDRSKLV